MLRRVLDLAFDLRDVLPDATYKTIADAVGTLHELHKVSLLLDKMPIDASGKRFFRQVHRDNARDMHVLIQRVVPLLLRARRELRRVETTSRAAESSACSRWGV